MNNRLLHRNGVDRIGEVCVRADLNRLELGDQSSAIEPRIMEVLLKLAHMQGEVVSRNEMIEDVWGVEFGGDESLSRAVSILRKTIKSLGQSEPYIETISKRGYRLVQPVTAKPQSGDEHTPTVISGGLSRELPELPSMAVLPFEMRGNGTSDQFAVDGLVEEVVAALSRIRTLFIIASGSTFAIRNEVNTPIEAGERLGVRYIVSGQAQSAGSRLRVRVEVADVSNGGVVWQDRFEGSMDDLFQLYDDVAAGVAGVVEFSVQQRETMRAIRRPTADLKAYELYLRGLAKLRTYTRQGMYEALDLLNEALERDPDYPLAHSIVAGCHANIAQSKWSDDPLENLRLAEYHTAESLTHGSDDPQVVGTGSLACKIAGDLQGASRLAERAYQLNPGSSFTQMVLAMAKLASGHVDEAEALMQLSIKLDPLSPNRTLQVGYQAAIGFARGDYAQAMELANEAVKYGQSPPIYALLIASCAHAGQLGKAAALLTKLESEAGISIAAAAGTFYEDKAITAVFHEGIAKARAG